MSFITYYFNLSKILVLCSQSHVCWSYKLCQFGDSLSKSINILNWLIDNYIGVKHMVERASFYGFLICRLVTCMKILVGHKFHILCKPWY